MQGLWKDAFAKLQCLSIFCDHFCLSEWNVSENTRLIVMQICILLFFIVCRKYAHSFQICQANHANYVKAYLHLLQYIVSSLIYEMFQIHLIQKSRSTLCLQLFSKHCCISKNVNDTAGWDKLQIKIYVGYPQNKFRLRILPLQRCSHDGAHTCRVCWFCGKVRTQFADIRTVFTHRVVYL
jgi:hypothetical protein